MDTLASYISRPLVIESNNKKNTAKELLINAIRSSRKFVPKQLHRLLSEVREKSESTMIDLSPIQGMMVESIEKVPENESSIVTKLMASFIAAKKKQHSVSEIYKPGPEWKRLLESQWDRYYKAINQQDLGIIARFLRNFFRNEAISGFWDGDRMFERFANLDGRESLKRANMMREQFEAWRATLPMTPVAELSAPQIGNPWGYIVEGKLLYEPICEYHYQANYFATLLSEVTNPVIIEIGGGFGGLGYQIIKRVPQVKYIGFDLPENVFLQSYYLTCAFPELKILTYDEKLTALTCDIIAEYDIILLPNFMIPEVESSVADLVVNVRSLSEMLVETIREYLHQIDRLGRLFFFHENIFKNRLDGLYGIPSSEFPKLNNFILVAESESRWPKYRANISRYPCHENLYIHRSIFR